MSTQPVSEIVPRPGRRTRLRRPPTPVTADGRKPRRFFGRQPPASPSLALTTPAPALTPPTDLSSTVLEPPARRSFLAKPPAPGAARRVLSVLNQHQQNDLPPSPPPPTSPSPSVTLPIPIDTPPIAPVDLIEPAKPAELDPPPAPIPLLSAKPAVKPTVAGSGYEDDPSLTDPHRLDDLRSDSDDETPTTSGNQPCSSSLDRRVSHLHEDIPEPMNRFDSVSSSMPSSRGTVRMIEVDASEVSDDIHSATDPKSRMNDLVGSASSIHTTSEPASVPMSTLCADLRFEHDPTVDISFDPVADDELEIPEAPNSLITLQPISMTSPNQHKLRLLQTEVATLQQQKAILLRKNRSLEQRNKDVEVLIESMRVRASESSSEVELLTRQVKDTKRRLTRRIRELEDNASTMTAKHSEEIARQRQVEIDLRAELDALRGPSGRQPDEDAAPTIVASRQRSDATANCSGATLPKPQPEGHTRSSLSSALETYSRSVDSPPCSGSARGRVTIVNSDAMRRRARAIDGVSSLPRSKIQSARPGISSRPGTPVRRFSVNLNHALSSSASTRKATPIMTPSNTAVVVKNPPGSTGATGNGTAGGTTLAAAAEPQSSATIRMMARKSLIRRAFIAHIHSAKYRSARSAWFDYFGAEGNQISTDQFARAVRSLAVAADARDRDLDSLREEVGGSESGDISGISWAAFSRFYQKTRNEKT